MTIYQKILSLFYHVLMRVSRKKAVVLRNESGTVPVSSFCTIPVSFINRKPLGQEEIKGKKILIVNTASNCGYTAQYKELQQLYDRYQKQVIIIGVPSNDFKQQEKGDDDAILNFCEANFGVRFPVTKESSVLKGANQHPLFRWLTDSNQNGWNDKEPKWNFSKYLVNEKGMLTHYFDPAISPLSEDVIAALSQ